MPRRLRRMGRKKNFANKLPINEYLLNQIKALEKAREINFTESIFIKDKVISVNHKFIIEISSKDDIN